jgi:hypothetical protein
MGRAEQIDDTQQDGPSDEDQQRRVQDHADRSRRSAKPRRSISHFAAAS